MDAVARRAPALLAFVIALLAGAACSGDVAGPPAAEPVAYKRWSDPTSWPGNVLPSAGSEVVVPAGDAILLDVTPPPLKSLRVDGRLTFDAKDLTLTSSQILVAGTLDVGSASRPFLHRAAIVLAGHGDSIGVPVGTKVLAVLAGGRLELHGLARTSWTRLAATAMQGSTQLVVERAVDWQRGDRIVVASTDYDPLQAEEAVLRSVDGSAVTLEQPLRYSHWGELQSFAGRTLDERAEVGLLSRNVVVRGDDASIASGLGGHLIVLQGGSARIHGAEFYLMGQRGRMARYPIHWHLTGSVDGQYVRGSSIWRSFNRCLTIHGAHGLLVERNVCYDNPGHAYFLEDGIETRNTLDGNLGLTTRQPAPTSALLASDAIPATFWITNPDNTVRGNVAAGSLGSGFWYALPEHPTGASATTAVWPRRMPLREFADNTTHSNVAHGLNVDDGPRPDGSTEVTAYTPRQSPTGDALPVVADFRNFTAWKAGRRAVWIRGTNLRLVGAVIAGHQIGVTFAGGENIFHDAVVIGESANNAGGAVALGGAFPIRGFEFYDGPVGVERVTFVNYQPSAQRQASALGFNRLNAFPVSAANYAHALTFVNANRVFADDPHAERDGDKAAVFVDRDGSVSGAPGASVVANSPLLLNATCARRAEWNAHVCASRYVQLYVRGDVGERVAPMEIRRDDGVAVSLNGVGNGPEAASMTLLAGRAYALRPATALTRPRLYFEALAPTDSVRIALPYAASTFTVFRDFDVARPLPAAASLTALDAGPGDMYFHDPIAGMLYVKVTGKAGPAYTTVSVDPR